MSIGKKQLLETAERMYLQLGMRSVSMDDISNELGISKKTLYQHVQNKEDLINQVLISHIEEEKRRMQVIHNEASDAIDELLRMARFIIKQLRTISPNTIYDLKKYYRKHWQTIEAHQRDYVYSTMEANLSWGVRDGFYRSDLNSDIITKTYVGITMLMVDEEVFPLAQYDKENLYKEIIYFYIRGISNSRGRELLKKYLS